MIDANPIRAVCNYGSSAPYKDPPSEEQIRSGVIPLDSLPAAWWNWLWSETNGAVNEARTAMASVIAEINSVLGGAGINPQAACTNQLYNSIVCLRQSIGTATVAGSVKSSTTGGQVSINATGIMTANGLGNVTNLSTTNKTSVVAAINELKTTYDCCFTTQGGDISTLNNCKLGCTECAADSAKVGGTSKDSLLTNLSFSNNTVCVTVGGTTCSATLGTAASCAATAFLSCTTTCIACAGTATTATCASKDGDGCAFGTAARCAATAFASCDIANCTGLSCTGTSTVPTNHASAATTYGVGTASAYGHVKICDCYTSSGGCASNAVAASSWAVSEAYECARGLGNATAYTKANVVEAGEAGAADCRINVGMSRSYRWSGAPQNVCSFDRRTYTYIGTCQTQNCCSGMTYIDTCVWQCCYSGTTGVTTCTDRRWCFHSNGYFYSPVGIQTDNGAVRAVSTSFGCMLVACRSGSANYASVTFCNCNGKLAHLGINCANTRFKRINTDDSTMYDILDTSAAVTVAQGGTGATTADAARTNLGLGTAASCAATAFLSCTTTCIACAGSAYYLKDHGGCNTVFCWSGCNGTPTWVWGSNARGITCVFNPACFTVCKANCASCNGSGTAFGSAATCAASAFLGATAKACCACYANILYRDPTGAISMGGALMLSNKSCNMTCSISSGDFNITAANYTGMCSMDNSGVPGVMHYTLCKTGGSTGCVYITSACSSASNPLYYSLSYVTSDKKSTNIVKGCLTTTSKTCIGCTYCSTTGEAHLYMSKCPLPGNLFSTIAYAGCAPIVSTIN